MTRIKWKKSHLLIFFSLLLLTISVFQPIVKNIAYKIMPMKDITISVENKKNELSSANEVYIAGYGVGNMIEFAANDSGLLDSFNNSKDNNGFKYLPSNPYFTNFIYSNEIGGKITIQGKPAPNFWISTVQRSTGGIISIKCGDIEKNYDLYSEKETIHRIYPFEFQKSIAIMWILIYIALYFVIFTFLSIAIYFFLKIIRKYDIEQIDREYNFVVGFIVFLLICFVYCIISYKNGVVFNTTGDASYYWNACTKIENENSGIFNFSDYGRIDSVTFRGYLFPFIIWILRKLSFGNEFVSYILYWIMSSAVTAAYLGIVMPKLYKILSGKFASYFQVFAFGAIYLLFWRMLTYAVLADLYSSTLLFTALLLLFSYLKYYKWIYMFATGISLGGAVLIRGNYILICYFIILLMLVAITMNVLFKNYIKVQEFKQRFLPILQDIKVIHFIVFLIGITIICIPQIIMNYARGRFGLFPYDRVGAWMGPLQTLMEYASATDYYGYLQGHPYIIQNPVGKDTIDYLYPSGDMLHIGVFDLIFIVIAKPMQAITIFMTRLFLLIDIKDWEEYPQIHNYFTNPAYLMFSVLNYITWAIALTSLVIKNIRKLIINNKELYLSICIFIFLGVPQVLYHVEWRYFINVYIIAYYIVGYGLVGGLIEKTTRKDINKYKKHLLAKVLVTTTICCIISIIFYIGLN